MTDKPIVDRGAIELYDAYTHGVLGTGPVARRTFLDRLARLAGGFAAANALLAVLENNYALADLLPEGDPGIAVATQEFAIGEKKISAYVARPSRAGNHPTLIVIHENRGLNPHIRDVTRRFASEGFLAIGPDLLSPLGGTPDDADKAREMIGTLDKAEVAAWLTGLVVASRGLAGSTGKAGAVGFCWGGGMVNLLAASDPTLDAGVSYYGPQPPAEAVAGIQAPLMLHYAGKDQRINAGIAAFEAALKQNSKRYQLFLYPNVDHAFNNDTNAARYNKGAAELAWLRSIDFLKAELG
jgi:carboxymethylenebutenolidase